MTLTVILLDWFHEPERVRALLLRLAQDGSIHVDDVGGHVVGHQDATVGELARGVDTLKTQID